MTESRTHSECARDTMRTTLPEGLTPIDRRRHPRVEPRARVLIGVTFASTKQPLRTLATDGADFVHTGLLRNISRGGLQVIFSPDILSGVGVGDPITVSMRLPEDVEELLVDGLVVYLRRRRKSRTISCGVAFAVRAETEGARKRIADFVLRECRARAMAGKGLRFW